MNQKLSDSEQLILGDKCREGCIESRNKLILSVYYFIRNFAKGDDDKFQYMMLKAIKAVQHFDRRKGALTTFLWRVLHRYVRKIRTYENIDVSKIVGPEIVDIDLSMLNEKELYIIKGRFWNNQKLKEIAKELNIKVERVRQIEFIALRKIKNAIHIED